MKLDELADEYLADNPTLVLDEVQTRKAAIAAARYFASYGDIRSLSQADTLLEAPGAAGQYPAEPEPVPPQRGALPIKALALIDGDTVVSVGEWAVIGPLFLLYTERLRAQMVEATRGLGVDVFGRSVSEIEQDITRMQEETLPAKAFATVLIEV
jgi:hypothetical protein